MPETCAWCEQDLTPEEIENPHLEDGEPICFRCECDEYEWECCLCCNWEDERRVPQHQFVAVFEGDLFDYGDGGPGIYRITQFPYFGGPMIGGAYFFADALEFIQPLPENADPENQDYPSGHLCGDCRTKLNLPAPLVELAATSA